MNVRTKGRGLWYGRRSGDQQDDSLETQLDWAIRKAAEQGVPLLASREQLQRAKQENRSQLDDMFIDDAISGSEYDRDGIGKCFATALADRSVSHIFVFNRDRFQRPDNPAKAAGEEFQLIQAGITLVLFDKVVGPSADGRANAAEMIMSVLDYHKSGEYLHDLSIRILESKRRLAEAGFSAGGRAPYGFGRYLKSPTGELTHLVDGRRVRQAGHHVVLLPHDVEKLAIWISILEMRERGLGGAAIANELNGRGIPSPDAGRTRRDNGVDHEVSGRWNGSTVNELCKNPIISGRIRYGRRSEGKHHRYTKDGSRPVSLDERAGKDGTRRMTNAKEDQLETIAGFEPLFPPDRFDALQEKLAGRSKSQAGISKNKDPGKYPLSTQVVDLTENCGGIMYGSGQQSKRGGKPCTKLVYKCGRYLKTGDCYHNSVDAEKLLSIVLRSIKHAITRTGSRDELVNKLNALATAHKTKGEDEVEIQRLKNSFANVTRAKTEIAKKLATETDPELIRIFRTSFSEKSEEAAGISARLKRLQKTASSMEDETDEARVNKSLQLLDRLELLATVPEARDRINHLLKEMGIWIGLEFCEGQWGKRRVRRLRKGIISVGGYHLPVPLHGRDNRDQEENTGDCGCSASLSTASVGTVATPGGGDGKTTGNQAKNDDEVDSLPKVSRGDTI